MVLPTQNKATTPIPEGRAERSKNKIQNHPHIHLEEMKKKNYENIGSQR